MALQVIECKDCDVISVVGINNKSIVDARIDAKGHVNEVPYIGFDALALEQAKPTPEKSPCPYCEKLCKVENSKTIKSMEYDSETDEYVTTNFNDDGSVREIKRRKFRRVV